MALSRLKHGFESRRGRHFTRIRSFVSSPPDSCKRRTALPCASSTESRRGRHRLNLLRAKRWARATPCMPHRKPSYLVSGRNVVDVIARTLQQNATRSGNWRLLIEPAEIRRAADCVERCRQLFEEQIRRRVAVPTPPEVDFENLCVSFRCGSDRRVTGGGAVRREFRKPVEDDPTPRSSRTPREPRAAPDAPRLSGRRPRRLRRGRQPCPRGVLSARRARAGHSRRGLEEGSWAYKVFLQGQQGVRLHAEARRFVAATQPLGSNWRATFESKGNPDAIPFRSHR